MRSLKKEEQTQSNERNLSDEVKWGIVISWKYFDQNIDQIVKIFSLKSEGTVSKIISKYKIQGDVSNNYFQSGRNSKQSSILDQGVIVDAIQQQNIKYTIQDVQNTINEDFGFEYSYKQVYEEMKELGLKYGRTQLVKQLSDKNKTDRVNFCKELAYQNLETILYSDETIFSFYNNNLSIWYSDDYNKNIEVNSIHKDQNSVHI
ncbi:hypothetical protein ABPG72_018598 [Tetrahymena utriculariae]